MLCNGKEEDGDVRSECQQDEGTDCEDGDSDTDSKMKVLTVKMETVTVIAR